MLSRVQPDVSAQSAVGARTRLPLGAGSRASDRPTASLGSQGMNSGASSPGWAGRCRRGSEAWWGQGAPGCGEAGLGRTVPLTAAGPGPGRWQPGDAPAAASRGPVHRLPAPPPRPTLFLVEAELRPDGQGWLCLASWGLCVLPLSAPRLTRSIGGQTLSPGPWGWTCPALSTLGSLHPGPQLRFHRGTAPQPPNQPQADIPAVVMETAARRREGPSCRRRSCGCHGDSCLSNGGVPGAHCARQACTQAEQGLTLMEPLFWAAEEARERGEEPERAAPHAPPGSGGGRGVSARSLLGERPHGRRGQEGPCGVRVRSAQTPGSRAGGRDGVKRVGATPPPQGPRAPCQRWKAVMSKHEPPEPFLELKVWVWAPKETTARARSCLPLGAPLGSLAVTPVGVEGL